MSIPILELSWTFRALGVAEDEVNEFVTRIDRDGDGLITYDDFRRAVRQTSFPGEQDSLSRGCRALSLGDDFSTSASHIYDSFDVCCQHLVFHHGRTVANAAA